MSSCPSAREPGRERTGQAARKPAEAGRRTVHDLLAEARAGFHRLTAGEAYAAALGGHAILVDTRSEDQRAAQGYLPVGQHHALSVLEWRVDPASGYSDPAFDLDTWVILICREGYSSSLAAARLQTLGLWRATDVIDGVDGWKAAGLPLSPTPT